MSLRSSMKNLVSEVSKLRGWKLAGILAGGLALAGLGGYLSFKNYQEKQEQRQEQRKQEIEEFLGVIDKYLEANPNFEDNCTSATDYVKVADKRNVSKVFLKLRAEGKLTPETFGELITETPKKK